MKLEQRLLCLSCLLLGCRGVPEGNEQTYVPHPSQPQVPVVKQLPKPSVLPVAYQVEAGPSEIPCELPFDLGAEEDPRNFPDEFLFDGGDSQFPVHLEAGELSGFEPEDTVVEYQDILGKKHIEKSNRIGIYAPRFGSVSTLTPVYSDTGVVKLSRSVASKGGNHLRTRSASIHQGQKVDPPLLSSRSSARGASTEMGTRRIQTGLRTHVARMTASLYENIRTIRSVDLKSVDEAQLAIEVQSAKVWSRLQGAKIVAQSESHGLVKMHEAQAELTGINKNAKLCKLKLIKTADLAEARPGELVTFVLRYENLGDLEMREVVISDNLTTRLEFVEGSEKSDREVEFSVEDNNEGSMVLRWKLVEPLPGKTAGVVGFQARVR